MLDIGAYPGGWSQVSSKIITSGKILSLDLQKMSKLKNVTFLQANFLEENTKKKIFEFFRNNLDVVISIWRLILPEVNLLTVFVRINCVQM